MILRWFKYIVIVTCVLLLALTLLPSLTPATTVIPAYLDTLTYTSSNSLTYSYAAAEALADPKDPLLEDIDASTGGATSMCSHLFLDKDKQVIDVTYVRQTDCFPQRLMTQYNQNTYGHADHEERTSWGFHQGTDISVKEPYRSQSPIYHVALWPGTVIETRTQANNAKGLWVVIDHGNCFYTRYQHLSSVSVKKGDVVQAGDVVGTMGGSGVGMNQYGRHAHIELILWPQAWDNSKNSQFYYGGVANLVWEGKSLKDIKWYQGRYRNATYNTVDSMDQVVGSQSTPY